MNIGDVAQRTGLPIKTIRYYEDIGLVKPSRAANGYRDFSGRDMDRLHLVAQGRQMGFTLAECQKLVCLNEDEHRASRDVRALAVENLTAVRSKIASLRALESRLQTLIAQCHGDDGPECAILEEMGAHQSAR
ncbi:MerR family transcriptional regulator [Defluviimonas sp. WL0002]|uniref:HTH-type transcriptional regulator CueR n=1 Tax=Albidovulum marisflavi TaxID=2984159 RepID=A0ABT2ZCE8_9RHOB|nr:MerR family transcriptional regulator [Defluviimonas sp. WL0002]MCV2868735.1 MerR family transcriptional regulator [Defluviimonas sp. WL0002]